MKSLIIISLLCSITLTGCVNFQQNNPVSSPTKSFFGKTTTTSPTESPKDKESEIVGPSSSPETTEAVKRSEVMWDLYPGMKLKIDELSNKHQCELLNELLKEYEGKVLNLASYIREAKVISSCP